MDATCNTKPKTTFRLARSAGRVLAACCDFIMPPLCLACRDRVFQRLPYCLACMRAMASSRWSEWVPSDARGLNAPPTWALFKMNAKFNVFVHGIKYADYPQGPSFMAQWARRLPNPFEGRNVGAVIPVPLHGVRLRERGFNQSLRLAIPLAARWELPVRMDLLKRVKATSTQTRQDEQGRVINMADAFTCPKPDQVVGKTVVVVDDVTTTGATLAACQDSLIAAGAKEVFGLTLAWVPRVSERSGGASDLNPSIRGGTGSIEGVRPAYVHLS
jgi:ComF family protein